MNTFLKKFLFRISGHSCLTGLYTWGHLLCTDAAALSKYFLSASLSGIKNAIMRP